MAVYKRRSSLGEGGKTNWGRGLAFWTSNSNKINPQVKRIDEEFINMINQKIPLLLCRTKAYGYVVFVLFCEGGVGRWEWNDYKICLVNSSTNH